MPFSAEDNLVGTDRLVCDPDLDGGNGGNGSEAAGSFMGGVFSLAASVPTHTIGLDDVSIEYVFLTRTGDLADLNPDESPLVCVGIDGGDDPVMGTTHFPGNSSSIWALWRGIASGFFIQDTSVFPRLTWSHRAVNYDRSGNMEMFDNGVSVGVSDMSSESGMSIAAEDIHPCQIFNANTQLFADWATPMAGYAVHSRLLTTDEIDANVAALNVGSYPETVVRYRFGSFVDASGDPLTPTRAEDDATIGPGVTWTLPAAYAAGLYAPEGVDGTVFIEDLSGNGRHYPLLTSAAYSSPSNLAQCGFSDLGAS